MSGTRDGKNLYMRLGPVSWGLLKEMKAASHVSMADIVKRAIYLFFRDYHPEMFEPKHDAMRYELFNVPDDLRDMLNEEEK